MFTQYLVLVLFIALPYILVWLRNLVWDIYLWQTKEYRLDRVRSQWQFEKDKGMREELWVLVKIALAIFVGIFMFFPQETFLMAAFLIAYFLYWYQGLAFIQILLKKKLLRFQIRSLRNLLILGLSLLKLFAPLTILLIWLGSLNYINPSPAEQQPLLNQQATFNDIITSFVPKSTDGTLVLKAEYIVVSWVTLIGLIMDLLTPFIVAGGVFFTWPLSALKRRYVISRGAAKLRKMKELKVIAVTGSYGKSTTKELLYQILRMRFNTVKTEKNNNTDIGIALTALNRINSATEVFVAEMGAYKIDETRDCCRVAKPDVAIITGVDQQHVSLFGGIRQVMASTYEVVEELEDNGLLILNGDNEYCLRIAEKTSKRKMLYYSVHNTSKVEASELDAELKKPTAHKIEFPANENVFVKSIRLTKKGLAFELNYDGRKYQVETNLQATYNISNLMAAILSVQELGVPMEEVVGIINALKFEVPYLNLHDGVNGSKILDDGYNTNPTGFISALKFLKGLEGKTKKWVLTQGLIELGEERAETNKKIAAEIITAADALYTTDHSLYEQIKKLDPKFEAKLVASVFDFPPYYEHLVKKNQVVLLEGAFPQDVLKRMYLKS